MLYDHILVYFKVSKLQRIKKNLELHFFSFCLFFSRHVFKAICLIKVPISVYGLCIMLNILVKYNLRNKKVKYKGRILSTEAFISKNIFINLIEMCY